jgi:hypothetical protein
MGLTITLEDETGKRYQEIGDPHHFLINMINDYDVSKTSFLRFIDPYGDTVFNSLQVNEFRHELAKLRDTTKKQEEYDLLAKIDELAKKCLAGHHLYLKIYGD